MRFKYKYKLERNTGADIGFKNIKGAEQNDLYYLKTTKIC